MIVVKEHDMDTISSQVEDVTNVDTSASGLIEDESLVEEISIDGMCGVY
jgi:mycofactocin precursor